MCKSECEKDKCFLDWRNNCSNRNLLSFHAQYVQDKWEDTLFFAKNVPIRSIKNALEHKCTLSSPNNFIHQYIDYVLGKFSGFTGRIKVDEKATLNGDVTEKAKSSHILKMFFDLMEEYKKLSCKNKI